MNVPQSTTDDDPDHAQFENNPNASFVQLSNTDQHLDFSKLDKDDTDTLDLVYEFYEPYYDPDGDGVDSIVVDLNYYKTIWTNGKGETVLDDTKDPLKVAFILEDSITLAARVWDAEAEEFGEKETIINIVNEEKDGRLNSIYLIKESAVADTILNTNALVVALGANGNLCGDERYPADIQFGRKDGSSEPFFYAKYRKPIEIAAESVDGFIDAVDYGQDGSFIKLEDLIAPYDWRGRSFADYENYWGYYGPFEIFVDFESASCDLSGMEGKVPNTLELKQLTVEEAIAEGLVAKDDENISEYGYVTYKNNGNHVKTFTLTLPVKVSYGFGIIDTNVDVEVAETIGTKAPRK